MFAAFAACLFRYRLSLSTWVITLHAEFDQQLDEPVPMPSFTLLRIGLPDNYHHQVQEI